MRKVPAPPLNPRVGPLTTTKLVDWQTPLRRSFTVIRHCGQSHTSNCPPVSIKRRLHTITYTLCVLGPATFSNPSQPT